AQELELARRILGEFSNISLSENEATFSNAQEISGATPSLAIFRRGGRWVVLHRSAAISGEPEIILVARLIRSSLESKRPWFSNMFSEDLASRSAGPGSVHVTRLSALPRDNRVLLVPRAIALIAVFLPFILSARSFSREVAFRTLGFLTIVPRSS